MSSLKLGGIYRHVKTGGRYVVLQLVVNATNADNGQMMVLYANFKLEEP